MCIRDRTGAAITAFALEINPPMTNVIGSYGSILAALIAAKIFKVSDGLYYAGLAFVFFASPMGSVMDLYRSCLLYTSHLFHYAKPGMVCCGIFLFDPILLPAYHPS